MSRSTERAVSNHQGRARSLRLSLRATILLVLVIGGWSGWFIRSARLQREAAAAVERGGGNVQFNWQFKDGQAIPYKEQTPPRPQWLGRLVGVDYFGYVTKAENVSPGNADAGLGSIGYLRGLEDLQLGGFLVTDDGLKHLRNLTSLRRLDLSSCDVTDQGLVHLEVHDGPRSSRPAPNLGLGQRAHSSEGSVQPANAEPGRDAGLERRNSRVETSVAPRDDHPLSRNKRGRSTMPATPRRRFQIADAMILIAATAIGLGLTRANLPGPLPSRGGPIAGYERFLRIQYALNTGGPTLAALTIALLFLRLKKPRPRLRRVFLEPGASACAVATFMMVVMTVLVLAAWAAGSHAMPVENLFMGCASLSSYAIVGAWLVLLLSGRWRSRFELD